ncbi:MAG: YihA family ribosome biogenesis GTP-binding protein [Rhodospirillales bacterium]|nr:YihA family ribosome biogenesis GTP-binding protein [Alphaproteobacteria bacterium]MCB9986683.1 YihA family ribosome biogenesis GTP-binding protein [Rhodospirillales bacterium]USO06791.1 MAG: YihA family ribosome biogenesis GTP-binding protein [Rhodospirillales bacterium]
MEDCSDKRFKADARFIWGAETIDGLPPAELPEIAFAGRSNVGKSSLINALLGRKSLVRTSGTPGQTRALNFFRIGDFFTLVDMPGYGFAKASKTDQKIWQDLMRGYLRGRVPLRLVCVLVDSRHGLKDSDREMLRLLDQAAVPTRLVLTKGDECKPAEQQAVLEKTAAAIKSHAATHPAPILTSTRDNTGLDTLRAAIVETLGLPELAP